MFQTKRDLPPWHVANRLAYLWQPTGPNADEETICRSGYPHSYTKRYHFENKLKEDVNGVMAPFMGGLNQSIQEVTMAALDKPMNGPMSYPKFMQIPKPHIHIRTIADLPKIRKTIDSSYMPIVTLSVCLEDKYAYNAFINLIVISTIETVVYIDPTGMYQSKELSEALGDICCDHRILKILYCHPNERIHLSPFRILCNKFRLDLVHSFNIIFYLSQRSIRETHRLKSFDICLQRLLSTEPATMESFNLPAMYGIMLQLYYDPFKHLSERPVPNELLQSLDRESRLMWIFFWKARFFLHKSNYVFFREQNIVQLDGSVAIADDTSPIPKGVLGHGKACPFTFTDGNLKSAQISLTYLYVIVDSNRFNAREPIVDSVTIPVLNEGPNQISDRTATLWLEMIQWKSSIAKLLDINSEYFLDNTRLLSFIHYNRNISFLTDQEYSKIFDPSRLCTSNMLKYPWINRILKEADAKMLYSHSMYTRIFNPFLYDRMDRVAERLEAVDNEVAHKTGKKRALNHRQELVMNDYHDMVWSDSFQGPNFKYTVREKDFLAKKYGALKIYIKNAGLPVQEVADGLVHELRQKRVNATIPAIMECDRRPFFILRLEPPIGPTTFEDLTQHLRSRKELNAHQAVAETYAMAYFWAKGQLQKPELKNLGVSFVANLPVLQSEQMTDQANQKLKKLRSELSNMLNREYKIEWDYVEIKPTNLSLMRVSTSGDKTCVHRMDFVPRGAV